MFNVLTFSENEDIQILENGEIVAELIFNPGSHIRVKANYSGNTMEIIPKFRLGSLIGLHQMNIIKNGNQHGRIAFKYFGSVNLYMMEMGVEKKYLINERCNMKCVLVDSLGNQLIKVISEFKLNKLKNEFIVNIKENIHLGKEQLLELLLCAIFCTNALLFTKTINAA